MEELVEKRFRRSETERVVVEPPIDLLPCLRRTVAIDGWCFTTGDAEELPVKRNDFIYADPPYDVEFITYSAGGFSWEDQVRTAAWLARHRGPVVLSNQATPRIVKLYTQLGFKLQFLDGPRRISCNGNRATAREVLALNASC